MSAQVRMVCHRCGHRREPDQPDQRFCPKDGLYFVPEAEHLKSPRDMFLGTVVGDRYPILGIVGQGGMGAVYLSVQVEVEREVAVKMVRPGGGPLEEMLKQRFRREAKAIAKVSHPCIVTLHDFGVEDDGTAYMVLELVRGKTLSDAFWAGEISRQRLTALTLEVLEALQTAHSAGLIHRDLKPENVMLLDEPSAHYSCKVLDFGLAKLAAASGPGGRLTRTGAVFGTPQYMAPEQAQGHTVDARTDLYSLGVILYEGLAGHLPFDHEQPWAIAKAHITDPPPPLPEEIPPELRELVRRSLSKDPAERHQSAEEMASELRTAISPTVVSPLPAGMLRPGPAADTSPDELSPRETDVLETIEASATDDSVTQVTPREPETDPMAVIAERRPESPSSPSLHEETGQLDPVVDTRPAQRSASRAGAAALIALAAATLLTAGWLLASSGTASQEEPAPSAPAPLPAATVPEVAAPAAPAPAPAPAAAPAPAPAAPASAPAPSAPEPVAEEASATPAAAAAEPPAPTAKTVRRAPAARRARPAKKPARRKKLQVPRRTLGR